MAWYHIPGNEQDIVISTQMRFARNLQEFPFPARLDAPRAREIITRVGALLEKNGFTRTDFADISRTAAYSLAEKHYVSSAFIRESLPHTLFLNEPCNLAVMVCEEDHIHLRSVLPGLNLQDAYDGVCKVETLLDSAFTFAFDSRLGYLSPCPARVGTGLYASVLLSLPLLTEAGRMETLARQAEQSGLIIRGLYREGGQMMGSLYRISNRATLGITEEETLAALEETVRRIMEAERRLRTSTTGAERDKLTDRIRRAEGTLKHAHLLSTGELVDLLSDVRLGVSMGILTDIKVEALTRLLIEGMPATLTLGGESSPQNDHDRDLLRAQVVQNTLMPIA